MHSSLIFEKRNHGYLSWIYHHYRQSSSSIVILSLLSLLNTTSMGSGIMYLGKCGRLIVHNRSLLVLLPLQTFNSKIINESWLPAKFSCRDHYWELTQLFCESFNSRIPSSINDYSNNIQGAVTRSFIKHQSIWCSLLLSKSPLIVSNDLKFCRNKVPIRRNDPLL